MKIRRLAILVIGLALAGISGALAQSKKELNLKIDSLEKQLAAKNESLVQLQIKYARLEGATDVHNEEIKRLETKADTLKAALIARNSTVESQASKIAQLTDDTNTLRAQLKEWTARNAALLSELEALKPKPADPLASGKSVKPGEPLKDELKKQ